jgi:hypothetical protein
MLDLKKFILTFEKKSRHHSKLINFIYPELAKLNNSNFLEFGVSEKGMSTELFLEFSNLFNCKLYSIDNIDYSKNFNNSNWKFVLSRDDNFSYVKKNIPEKFELILLDTIHEAKHVENIIFNYYDMLKVNHCFFVDDISWLPYLKNSEKNRFYGEINNLETFNKILEIYYANRDNMLLEFTFQGTGMCKIKKLTNNKLNYPKKIKTRDNTIKNLIRKLFKG